MRKSVVETTALAAALIVAGMALGQPAPVTEPPAPKPAQSKLEEMLEKALKDNPDVRLAAAKLAEAEAELNRARLQVVHQVATAYQAIEAQKAAVESAAAELAEVKAAVTGAVSTAKVRAAERALIDAKAKLASLEADLPYLLGQQAAGVDDKVLRVWLLKDAQQPSGANYAEMLRRYYLDVYGRLPTKDELAAGPRPVVQGPTADRIRAALDKPFTLACKKKSFTFIVREMNKAFQEASHGLLIKDSGTIDDGAADDEPGELSVHFDAMPFGAALQWLEDTVPGNRVVVRDYGLVIAPADQLPPGAPLLHDFWKGVKAEDKNPQPGAKDEQPKPPAKSIDGQIKDIDAAGRVRVNIGRNDGLAKGDMLEAARLSEMSWTLLLGEFHVVEVGASEAVAEPKGELKKPIQLGDHLIRMIQDPNPLGAIEGQVTEIRTQGQVAISVGSDTGVTKGDTLTVYRAGKEPKEYLKLGVIEVQEVMPLVSICRIFADGYLGITLGPLDRVVKIDPKK